MTKTVDHTIPDRYVGLMIGKGGDSISRLQDDSGAKIQISPESVGAQRPVTITGTHMQIELAKQLMDIVIQNAEKNTIAFNPSDLPRGQDYLEMAVPGPKVGLLIGKNGETIKSLQEKAGVRMFLIQDSSTATLQEKPLRITGPSDRLQYAKELVLELLNSKDAKEFPPGHRSGNYGDSFREISVPRRCVGVVIGKGGEMLRKISQETGARVQFRQEGPQDHDLPERLLQVGGSEQAVEQAFGRVQHLINAVMTGEIPVTDRPRGMEKKTATYAVPAEKAGLVIGKGGDTVKEINRVSGAYVSIQRDQHGASETGLKVFDIQGSASQISEAVRLICEKAGLPHDQHFSITAGGGSSSSSSAAAAAAAAAAADPTMPAPHGGGGGGWEQSAGGGQGWGGGSVGQWNSGGGGGGEGGGGQTSSGWGGSQDGQQANWWDATPSNEEAGPPQLRKPAKSGFPLSMAKTEPTAGSERPACLLSIS
uniref:KH domain-containing protein n=1 Tax=Macrostomum lignano TaxID=282301 RepID=A0A1I8HE32_9PLAT